MPSIFLWLWLWHTGVRSVYTDQMYQHTYHCVIKSMPKHPKLHLHQSVYLTFESFLKPSNPPSFDLKMSYLWGEHPSPSPSLATSERGTRATRLKFELERSTVGRLMAEQAFGVDNLDKLWWVLADDDGWSLKCKQRWDDESRLQDNEQEGVLVNVPHTPHTGTWVCERLVLTCGLANIWWGWLRQQNWSTIWIAIHLGPLAQSCLEPGAWKQLVEESCSPNMPKPSRLCGRNVLGYIPTQCKSGADSPQTEVNPKPTAGCLSIQPVIDPIGSRHKGPWRLTRTALCFKWFQLFRHRSI